MNRNSIFLFVNGRLIRDRLLLHALSAAYHNLMPPACYPFALLFLDCDPEGESGMKQCLGYLAQLIPVRLAWTSRMYGGKFKGRHFRPPLTPQLQLTSKCRLFTFGIAGADPVPRLRAGSVNGRGLPFYSRKPEAGVAESRSTRLPESRTRSQRLAYVAALANSIPTNDSSPTTRASCPGGIVYDSPGLIVIRVPSVIHVSSWPETQ